MKAIVNKRIDRPDQKWIDKIKDIPSSIISDCLNRYYAMDGAISPVFNKIRMCGVALTIQSMTGNNLMSHLALTFAQPGDILAIDAKQNVNTAVWGGIQTLYAQKRGVAGVVIDGSLRDVEEIRDAGFPAFCRGVTPAGPHKGWADSINVPIQCGGIPVAPGDIVVGDDDGVAIIPLKLLEQVYQEAKQRMEQEQNWIDQINKGKSSLEVVGLDTVLEKMDIQYNE
jgi:regulator of RNase E activity RraA